MGQPLATGRADSQVRAYLPGLLGMHARPLECEIMGCLTHKVVRPDCSTRLHYCPAEKVVVGKPNSLEMTRVRIRKST